MPHNCFRLVVIAFSAAALPAFAATLGGGGDPRALDLSQTFDFATSPAANTDTYVATQAEGKLKGITRVGIVNMCVQFVNSKVALGSSAGASISYTRSADGSIPGGLDAAKMQAVADAWLDQIESDFKAAGIEVLPYEQIASNDLFKKYAAKYEQGLRVATRSDTNNQKGKTGETAVYVSPKGRPFAIDCGTISPISTATFVRMSYPLNAEFVSISGVIDMGEAKSTGGLLRGARAEIDYAEFVRAGVSQFQFIGKTGPGTRLWLKQSIVPPQNPFQLGESQKNKMTKSTDELSGVTTRTQETAQSISFDEDLYFRNAGESLRAMHQMFLAKIATRK